MKTIFAVLVLTLICGRACSKESVYQGSTPAHTDVRDFLGISLTDSIDFIRWRVVMSSDHYELICQYGMSEPSTSGFIDEKKLVFSGALSKQGNYYKLQRGRKTFYLLEINSNLLHLADKHKALLIGDGSYSYALNNNTPIKSDQFNLQLKQSPNTKYMAFQGRTPCQELASLMGEDKSPACNKMKWYIILYLDSVTGQPSYYLKGGRGYKKETMTRGSWEITRRKDGMVIYKLDAEKKNFAVYLLRADDNILIFTDPEGNLLVGNEDFSYTLNRTIDREPVINK
jgi:hypothetical protein